MTVITDNQPTRVIHPSKTTLDFPALAIRRASTNGTTTFGFARFTALECRNDWLNAALSQIAAKDSAVVGFVSNQFIGTGFRTTSLLWNTNGLQGGLCQRHFMRLRTLDMQANRQPIA